MFFVRCKPGFHRFHIVISTLHELRIAASQEPDQARVHYLFGRAYERLGFSDTGVRVPHPVIPALTELQMRRAA